MPIDLGVASLGSAAIGAAGSLFSGKQSADFAERAYKHRYQWQMKDMQKAGLNPMLAFSQGAPNVPQPNFPNVGEAVGTGIKAYSAGAAARLMKAQETNVAFDSNLKNEQAGAAAASARQADAQAELLKVEARIKGGSESNQIALVQAQLDKALEDVKTAQNLAASSKQTLDHQALLYPLERELVALGNRLKQAEIAPKEVIAAVAESISKNGGSLSGIDYKQLARDTKNLIEDKASNASEWARNLARKVLESTRTKR